MPTFFRLHADRTRTDAALDDQFAGPAASTCWLIGGGPSLAQLPIAALDRSPAPKMCINLAGTGLLRPTFWTAYDPSARFLRSVYLDPGIMKFVPPRRAMDLVPETTFKVCECPHLYFFETDPQRGFADFLSPQRHGIVDWNDTFVQALDILHRLGFRRILLAGCELQVAPGPEWQQKATERNVAYRSGMLLGDFVKECERAGLTRGEMERWGTGPQYHFDESKSLQAAVNTDAHYFRIAQSLRLCRRSLTSAGLQLISVTPGSRLNDYISYQPCDTALRDLLQQTGDPAGEQITGLYTRPQNRAPRGLGPMRDYRPRHWPTPPAAAPPPSPSPPPPAPLPEYLAEIPDVVIHEEG